MRIGLVTDEFNPEGGGAERWTAAFAAYLVSAGHDVLVVAFRGDPAATHIPLRLLPDPGNLIGRARAVEAALPSLAGRVLHDGGTGWSAHVFHPQTGSRLLSMEQEISSHAAWRRLRARVSPRLNLRRWRMAQIEHQAATRARHVIAVSHRLQGLLAARHGLDPVRIVRVPNGVDTAHFAAAALRPLRAAARAEYGLGDDLACLMVAHNLRLKGLDTCLLALAQGAPSPRARLLVAGGLPDRLWSDLAQSLGIADRVTFLGQVSDMRPLYAAADVLLNPTRWDACSLATLEAMAAGLPVITTAANGAADLIEHASDGFVLADANDHRGLARTLAALADPALRHRIGRAAEISAARADLQANLRAVEAVLAQAAQSL